jgi:hypothetical protein
MNLVKDLPDVEINGEVLYSQELFNHTVGHLNWFTDNPDKIIHKNISDINKNENFYFVHFISWFSTENVVELYSSKNNFSDKLQELLKKDNFKLIILDVHEVHNYNLLDNLFKNFVSNVMFINNDLNIKFEAERRNWKVDTEKTNFLIWNSIKGWKQIYNENTFLPKTNTKLFLCKNKNIKLHRLYFLSYLKKYNLLENFNYSNLDIHQWNNYEYYKDERFDDESFYKIEESIKDVISDGRKNTDYEIFVQKMNDINITDSGYNFAGEILIDDYLNTLVNVVTESVYFDDMIHISEKSFKPFTFFQLPIFVASHNHVSYLRDYYGLDLYDDFINHDYDKIKNPAKRMEAIVKEIQRLNNIQTDVFEFIKNNKKRFVNNFNQLDSILVEKRDLHIYNKIKVI